MQREGKANLGLQHPVGLRFERLDFIMSLHTEAQGRGLTWPKRDEGAVQIAIFSLEVLSLKPTGRHGTEKDILVMDLLKTPSLTSHVSPAWGQLVAAPCSEDRGQGEDTLSSGPEEAVCGLRGITCV